MKNEWRIFFSFLFPLSVPFSFILSFPSVSLVSLNCIAQLTCVLFHGMGQVHGDHHNGKTVPGNLNCRDTQPTE